MAPVPRAAAASPISSASLLHEGAVLIRPKNSLCTSASLTASIPGSLWAKLSSLSGRSVRGAPLSTFDLPHEDARGSRRQGCRSHRLQASASREAAASTTTSAKHHGHHHQDKKHHPDHHHPHHGSHRRDDAPDMMKWLKDNGLPEVKVAFKDRHMQGTTERPMHVVVASEDLQPGDTAFQVPAHLVVTLERVLGDETIAELLTTNKLSELACLALYLMYEKKRGKESFWYPFIKELDRQRGRGQLAVESPLLWSRPEIEEFFQGSPMQHIVQERLQGIEREYNELDTVWFMAGSLFKEYPFDLPTEAFPFHIFKGAFAAVQASVVHLQGVNLARRFALVPLGPPLLEYRSTSRAMIKAVNGNMQLDVDQPYKAGEAIHAWCGPQPNTKLLLNYGFVDDENPYDRLEVEAALDQDDPLYSKKRMIVQRNEKLAKQIFQIYKGREKDAVVAMLPYMRLAHVSDSLEMDSVVFAQGEVCPVSPCNEHAVLEQIKEYAIERLSQYKTTPAEDERIIHDKGENPKRRVATKLLRTEKQILGNFLEAIRTLIEELPKSEGSFCPGRFPAKLK